MNSAIDQAERTGAAEAEGLVENPMEITEHNVIAFLKAHADALSKRTGVPYSSIKVELTRHRNGTTNTNWACYVAGSKYYDSATLEEVLAKQVAAMAPEVLAASKREAAAKLLAEADAIEQRKLLE